MLIGILFSGCEGNIRGMQAIKVGLGNTWVFRFMQIQSCLCIGSKESCRKSWIVGAGWAERFTSGSERAEREARGKFSRSTHPYIKLNGEWVYLYRAVDREGHTVDFCLRAKRDAGAAKAFFRKAFKENGRPDKVTVDKSGSNKAALDSFNRHVLEEDKIEIRQTKYLNNVVEQDYRFCRICGV